MTCPWQVAGAAAAGLGFARPALLQYVSASALRGAALNPGSRTAQQGPIHVCSHRVPSVQLWPCLSAALTFEAVTSTNCVGVTYIQGPPPRNGELSHLGSSE